MRARAAALTAFLTPAVAVLLLAGCSTSSGATSSATPTAPASTAATRAATTAAAIASRPVPANPCDLLSKAEASKAIGSPVSSTFRTDTNCAYDNEDHGFAIDVYAKGGDERWEDESIGMKAQFGKTPAINGLGDRAVGIGGHVVVQSGSTVFSVDDDFADKDPRLSRAIAVAKIVLGHL